MIIGERFRTDYAATDGDLIDLCDHLTSGFEKNFDQTLVLWEPVSITWIDLRGWVVVSRLKHLGS